MSREAAMAVATGSPVPPPVAAATTDVSTQSPGLAAAEPPKPVELDSTRFNHLAAKEAALVKQREEFKREREALEAEKLKLKPAYEEWQKFQELKEKDKIAAIKAMGFTDTDIINAFAVVEDTSTPEEKAAKAAQAEINKFKEEQQKLAAAQKKDQYDRTLKKFDEDIASFVTSDKEKFEYINFNGVIAQRLIRDTVTNVLLDELKTNPNAVPISIQEAAELVEKFYEDEDKRMSAIKKRQPAPPKQEEQSQPAQDQPLRAEVAPRPTNKTLTNKATASITNTIPRRETPSEKRARLEQMLRNMPRRG